MNLKEKLEKEQEKTNKLLKLMEQFPDLAEEKDRCWGNIYLKSKLVNPIINDIYFKRGCGCCEDSPYYAYMWILVDGERIYSNPTNIEVEGFQNKTTEQQKEYFEKNNLNIDLLERITRFKINRDKSYYKYIEDEQIY